MIKLVAFDFDGTLVDSNACKEDCVFKVIGFVPGAFDVLEDARAVGGNRYTLFHEIASRIDPKREPEEAAQHGRAMADAYTRCCAQAISAAPERRGARKTLGGLRSRGIKIVVNSGTPHVDLPGLLRRRGLASLVDGYFGSPVSKADNLRRAMQMARVAAKETLVVGDGPDDLHCARQVGAWFSAITAEQRIMEKVRFAMRDLTPLLHLVDRLNAAPRRGPDRLRHRQ